MPSNLTNKVNTFPGLKANAIPTLYINSTTNIAYNYFPTLHLVSFKQPRYYLNQMRCCAINKEDNAMLVNVKIMTSRKKKQEKQQKTVKTKKRYLKERNFCQKKILRGIFSRLNTINFNFRGKNFSWLILSIISIPQSSCAPRPQVIVHSPKLYDQKNVPSSPTC